MISDKEKRKTKKKKQSDERRKSRGGNAGMIMMMMKLSILPCAEKLELVLSTAAKTRDNTDKDSKNRRRSH